MSGRGGLATFFLFLFLSITILLQVLSIVQSDRLYERLNHLNQALERAVPVGRAKVTPEDTVTSDDVHPGDDGDWLIWAFRVEPKTLNPISAETDVYTVWITIPYIFEPLLVYDYDPANGRLLKPHLAESYEVSSSERSRGICLHTRVFGTLPPDPSTGLGAGLRNHRQSES